MAVGSIATVLPAIDSSNPERNRRLDHVDVERSLKDGEFIPYFQPLVVLRTGQLAGFEVLARWQHPTLGMIPPDEFIPLAERDGWIGALFQHMLQKALDCSVLMPAPMTLAVNISPWQLLDEALPEQFDKALKAAKFSPERLVIEITESALITNLDAARVIALELKSLGCKLALDDFGTGYSSLLHLQSMPFDKLKLDRSFVGSMAQRRESRKIVAAVIGLGHSLDLTTIAEGIETQEQAEMLLWLGCALGQGFLFGKPVPAEGLASTIAESRRKIVAASTSPWSTVSEGNLDAQPAQRLAHLQAVYDGAPVGLGFIDRDLCYVNLNKKLADMNGASVEDHLGSPVAEMVPELFPVVEPFLLRALDGEAITDVEATVVLPGAAGEETRLVSYQPAVDEAGEVVGVSVAVIDITERKQAQDALRESEEHYRSMIELNPQVLWIMDPNGRNLDVSPRWEKTTGVMKEHVSVHSWLDSLHPEDAKRTAGRVAVAMQSGTPINVEYRARHADGRWHWMRSRGAPRFNADGKIVCWYGSVEDINEVKQGEQAPFEIQAPPPTTDFSAMNVA